MAYLRNSIGPFNFISLEGAVDIPGQVIVVDSRPGVDGMEFTLLGLKGQPFPMISTVDIDDLFWSDPSVQDYKTLIELGAVDVWKNGVPLLADCLVKVLNVTKLDTRQIATAVGNKLSAQSGALLVCRWDLVAVPIP